MTKNTYTLAQLKRDLKVGDTLICLYHNVKEKKEQKRIIDKVNTVEVRFETGVHLRFPLSSKLVEYKKDTFSIYAHGKNYIDKETFDKWKKSKEKLLKMGYEKHYEYMLKNPLEKEEDDRIWDILCDYSNLNCEDGERPYKWDKNIKGILLYTFKILKTSLLNK